MTWFQRLKDGTRERGRGLLEQVRQRDAQVGQLAGLLRLQAQESGIERNREMLLNAPEEEVMQRVMAERALKRDSAQEEKHRRAIRMGGAAREKHFKGYAPDMNRGPMGIGEQGILEMLAGAMENNRTARVAGLYAPAAVMGVGGLTAAGQGLLELIASREEAVATLAELEAAAAAARQQESLAAGG